MRSVWALKRSLPLSCRISGGRMASFPRAPRTARPTMRSAAASGRDWMGIRTTDDTVLKSVDRLPLFGGVLGLALLVFALGAMWWREGR